MSDRSERQLSAAHLVSGSLQSAIRTLTIVFVVALSLGCFACGGDDSSTVDAGVSVDGSAGLDSTEDSSERPDRLGSDVPTGVDGSVECRDQSECGSVAISCEGDALVVNSWVCNSGICEARMSRRDCGASSTAVCTTGASGVNRVVGFCDTSLDTPACATRTETETCGGGACSEPATFMSPVCQDDGAGASCGHEAVACEGGGPPTCFSGRRTLQSPDCDSVAGCSVSPETAACPTARRRCERSVHISYEPRCRNGSDCDLSGREIRELCQPPPPDCRRNVHTVYLVDCDDVIGCGSLVDETRSVNCDSAGTSACEGQTAVNDVCACEPGTGCDCRPESVLCTGPYSECVGRNLITYGAQECRIARDGAAGCAGTGAGTTSICLLGCRDGACL